MSYIPKKGIEQFLDDNVLAGDLLAQKKGKKITDGKKTRPKPKTNKIILPEN